MDKRIKIILGLIGGGSLFIGTIVVILFLVGEPTQANEVRQISVEIDKDMQEVKEEVAQTGKTILGQLNDERKKAVAQEKDPYISLMLNSIFLYIMGFMIYIFVMLILTISKIRIR